MARPLVLVHGGWHGAWCWRDVASRLRTAGHDVLTPTLTGLGDRAHLASRDVDLELHVFDVVATLHAEDVRDAVLVGHSYGGMVIAGVADRARERLAHVVYLDAFLPQDGESLFAILPPDRGDVLRAAARDHGNGWFVPPLPAAAYDVADAATAAWADERLCPQPLATFAQPAALSDPPGTHTPCTYVRCTANQRASSFASSDERARAMGFGHEELAAGHDAMLTEAGATASLLAAVARA
jgi:pimeloyl-ACP methyl ester carboxylesterase